MRTNIESVKALKQLMAEIIFNKTSKISKISDDSVVNAFLYGEAKAIQKGLKDVAIVESQLFSDSATGVDLDIIADRQGVSPRFGDSSSATYVRLVADLGTLYSKNSCVFKSNEGISFSLSSDFTMTNNSGYDYVQVRSTTTGLKTNVSANSISSVSPVPIGHKYVINEYMAIGGVDIESDDIFRKRIKEAPNYMTSGTLAKMTQVFIKINPNILNVIYGRIDVTGKIVLCISTQNGVFLDSSELSDLITETQDYLSLTDMRLYNNQSNGIIVENISYNYIDLDFKIDISNTLNIDDVRKSIQINISKFLDFRFWDYTKSIQWVQLLNIIKNTKGVNYISDDSFIPNHDISLVKNQLPRLRGFIMRNLQGDIIIDNNNNINPVYYQNTVSVNYISSVL